MTEFSVYRVYEVGDVVQIDPERQPGFGGCLAIIEEVRDWGVVAYVPVPDKEPGTIAPIRLEWADCSHVGKAKWTTDEEAE